MGLGTERSGGARHLSAGGSGGGAIVGVGGRSVGPSPVGHHPVALRASTPGEVVARPRSRPRLAGESLADGSGTIGSTPSRRTQPLTTPGFWRQSSARKDSALRSGARRGRHREQAASARPESGGGPGRSGRTAPPETGAPMCPSAGPTTPSQPLDSSVARLTPEAPRARAGRTRPRAAHRPQLRRSAPNVPTAYPVRRANTRCRRGRPSWHPPRRSRPGSETRGRVPGHS